MGHNTNMDFKSFDTFELIDIALKKTVYVLSVRLLTTFKLVII